MPKNEPSRVRFSEEQNAILKKIAAACDVTEVTVARWAVEALGAYWQAHGERLLLPLDFRQRFTVRSEPLVLHEPPTPARGAGSSKMKTGAR